jgi:hypothetical protein
MVAISTIGHEMAMALDKHIEALQDDERIAVHFKTRRDEIIGVEALHGEFHQRENGDTFVNRKQLEELKRSGAQFKPVNVPTSYKPAPVSKTLRR